MAVAHEVIENVYQQKVSVELPSFSRTAEAFRVWDGQNSSPLPFSPFLPILLPIYPSSFFLSLEIGPLNPSMGMRSTVISKWVYEELDC